MVRNNFLFLKNIKYRFLTVLIYSDFCNNFIFLKKYKIIKKKNLIFLNLKKLNFNKNCVNIIYF